MTIRTISCEQMLVLNFHMIHPAIFRPISISDLQIMGVEPHMIFDSCGSIIHR